MKLIKILFITLGAYVPSVLLSQNNNRISLQTGLFHSFFDGSAIVNSEPTNPTKRIKNYKILSNLLQGILNDSRGINYQRKINSKFSLSIEYMTLIAGYEYNQVFNNNNVKPVIVGRNLKYINLSFLKIIQLSEKFDFSYGSGFNYLWGHESLYHYTLYSGWGEPRFYGYDRKDFGINLRTGIEYTPIKRITLFTNVDFLGITYLGAEDLDGNNVAKFYKDKFDLKNIPSRYDLSWRFGIGFNFGN
jgi:hypothetical protein